MTELSLLPAENAELKNTVNELRYENSKLKELTATIPEEEAKLLGRIHKAKILLKQKKLKKSGYNNHNKYSYFELSDFLPSLEVILEELGLASYIYFENDEGVLTVFDPSTGINHSWRTKCISAEVKENGFDVGVHMKSIQAIQTYARRTLYLQAFDIVEPNEIESDTTEKKKPAKKKTVPKSPVKPIKEKKVEKVEITAERIQEILKNAQEIFDEHQADKDDKDKKPFTWDNAKFVIRKQCRNEAEFSACSQSLVFQKADEVE